MVEALAYAAKRVPELYREVSEESTEARKEEKRGSQPRLIGRGADKKKKLTVQQPALFDFNRNRRDVLLEVR